MNYSLWIVVGFFVAGIGFNPAAAQETEFEWTRCNGASARSCRDLMSSLNVPPAKREVVHKARASLLLQEQDLIGAIEEYQEILLLTPNDPETLKSLAFFEGLRRNWTSASTYIRSALRISPDDPDLRPMLAVSLAKDGDCKGALLELDNATILSPGAPKIAEARPIVASICG